MSDDTKLQVSGLSAPSVAITPAAIEAKRALLEAVKGITQVIDAESQTQAVNVLAALKTFTNQVEASKETAKRPVIDLGRKIDAMVKDLTTDVLAEEKRLKILIGAFADNERRKADAAAAAARKEEEMIKETLRREELARIGQESAGRTGTLLQDLDSKRDQAAEQIVQVRQQAAAASVAMPTGVSARKAWKFEVVDVDALFKARPELCKIEANNAAIRAILAPNNGKEIPGLKIWSETAAIVSSRVSSTLPAKAEDYDY